MDGGIYLLPEGGPLIRMMPQPCTSERTLQSLLAQYPSLLAGDQIDTTRPRRWMLVAREVPLPVRGDGVGRWSVDHLFLDQEGIPTLVEVKRGADARLRREVVGQLLDYAAHAVHAWTAPDLSRLLEERCSREGLDGEQVLAELLEGAWGPAEFWEQVRENLDLGRIRLVFVADEVPPELAKVVTFLNAQMDPAQVVAVQVRQYAGHGLKVVVPQVLGHPPPPPPRKASTLRAKRPKRTPTPAAFFATLENRRGVWEAAVAHRLTTWATQAGLRLIWTKDAIENLVHFVVTHEEHDYQLFSLSTDGSLEVNFRWYAGRPPFDRHEARLEFRRQLNLIPEVRLPLETISDTGAFSLTSLLSESALRTFCNAVEWALTEIHLSWYGEEGLGKLSPAVAPGLAAQAPGAGAWEKDEGTLQVPRAEPTSRAPAAGRRSQR
jgi:hypothetical protein